MEIPAALGREEAIEAHRAELARMHREYVAFLEEEVRRCREQLGPVSGGTVA